MKTTTKTQGKTGQGAKAGIGKAEGSQARPRSPEPGAQATSHEGSVARQRRAAMEALLERINGNEAKITAIQANMGQEFLRVVNLMTEQGRDLMELTQREQLDFDFYNGFADRLPERWDFEVARKRIAMARALPPKVTSLVQMDLAWRKWTAIQLDLLPGLRGLLAGDETLAAPNLQDGLGLFCLKISVFKQTLQKVIAEKPVEKWSPPERAKFLSETLWIEEARGRMKAIEA